MTIPHTKPANWPSIAPGRFAATIARTPDPPTTARIALVGIPDDLGVLLNHGRPGAHAGPASFRSALARYGCNWDAQRAQSLDPVVWDAGDLDVQAPTGTNDPEPALHETHRRVTDAALALHRAGMVVCCVGGGHDLTFPAVRALSQHAAAPVGGVNVDPHLDVRETVGSGMPFRALIERGHLDPRRFTTLGTARFANSREHTDWLTSHGGTIITHEQFIRDIPTHTRTALNHAASAQHPKPRTQNPIFLSFDLDSLDAAFAPGVSALNPCGLAPAHAAAIAAEAGRHPCVRHFDLMELNPAHDEPPDAGRTARIAAFLFLTFVAAFAERPA